MRLARAAASAYQFLLTLSLSLVLEFRVWGLKFNNSLTKNSMSEELSDKISREDEEKKREAEEEEIDWDDLQKVEFWSIGGRQDLKSSEYLEDLTEVRSTSTKKGRFVKISSLNQEGLNAGKQLEVEYVGLVDNAPKKLLRFLKEYNLLPDDINRESYSYTEDEAMVEAEKVKRIIREGKATDYYSASIIAENEQ